MIVKAFWSRDESGQWALSIEVRISGTDSRFYSACVKENEN